MPNQTASLTDLRQALNDAEGVYQAYLSRNVAQLSLQEQVDNDLQKERAFETLFAASNAYKAAIREAAKLNTAAA